LPFRFGTNEGLNTTTLLESGKGLVELFEWTRRPICEHVVPSCHDVFSEACVVVIKVVTRVDNINCVVGKTAHQLVDIVAKVWTSMFATLSRPQGIVDIGCELA
jgi:hypothetical protein